MGRALAIPDNELGRQLGDLDRRARDLEVRLRVPAMAPCGHWDANREDGDAGAGISNSVGWQALGSSWLILSAPPIAARTRQMRMVYQAEVIPGGGHTNITHQLRLEHANAISAVAASLGSTQRDDMVTGSWTSAEAMMGGADTFATFLNTQTSWTGNPSTVVLRQVVIQLRYA